MAICKKGGFITQKKKQIHPLFSTTLYPKTQEMKTLPIFSDVQTQKQNRSYMNRKQEGWTGTSGAWVRPPGMLGRAAMPGRVAVGGWRTHVQLQLFDIGFIKYFGGFKWFD